MGYEVGQKVDYVIEQQHRPALLPMRVVSMVRPVSALPFWEEGDMGPASSPTEPCT